MSIFKEESGKWSSKRIAGLSSFAVCLITFLWDAFKSGEVDFSMWSSLLGVGTAVLIGTAFKKSFASETTGNSPDPDKEEK